MPPCRGELLPERDTDVSTESEAPQRAGRKLRRYACASVAVFAAVCTVAAAAGAAPLRRAAAAPREEDPSRTREFLSLNERDAYTLLKRETPAHSDTLTVDRLGIFHEGDIITIINTFNNTSKNAVVAKVQAPDQVVLTELVGVGCPARSLIIRPFVEEEAPATAHTPAPTPAPTAQPIAAPPPLEVSAVVDKPGGFNLPLLICSLLIGLCCCLLIGFFITMWCRPSGPVKATKRADKHEKDKVTTKTTSTCLCGDDKLEVDSIENFRRGQKVHIKSDFCSEEAYIRDFDHSTILLEQGLRSPQPVGATVMADLHEDDVHGHHMDTGLNTPRRQSKIASLFRTLDTNNNGFLSCDDLFKLAQVDGFPGRQEQWEVKYRDFMHTHFQNSDIGCNHSNFTLLVDDKTGGFFLSDYDLDNYTDALDPKQHHHGDLRDDGEAPHAPRRR